MKGHMVASAVACLLIFQGGDTQRNELTDVAKWTAIVTNRNSKDDEWAEALRQLDRPPEPPSVWTKVANDSAYSVDRRRQALFKLFERHIAPRTTLKELGHVLAGAKWLNDGDVVPLLGCSGIVPLKAADAATSDIRILPGQDRNDPSWHIYLRISKKLEAKELARALRGEELPPRAGEIKVLEYALCNASKSKDSLENQWR